MHKTETFEIKLLSVNEFEDLATSNTLDSQVIKAVSAGLTAFYNAQNLSSRLESLLSFMTILTPYEYHSVIKKLLDPCRDILQLFMGANSFEDVQELLADRRLKKSFVPNYMRNPPKDAPHRWLLDKMVQLQQTTELHEKEKISDEINRASIYKGKKSGEPMQSPYTSSIITPNRRNFMAFSQAHKLIHLTVKGSYKLPDADYRNDELKRGVKDASSQEKEQKRVYPMNGHLYQIHLIGSDNDRFFQMSYYSTEECEYNKAAFIVTTAGDIFAESNGPMGSRFDKEPFFAGQWTVVDGVLRFYNNFSECFAHDERNLLSISRYFRELGLISASNPNVICTLVRQREIPNSKAALIQHLHGFEEFPLWEANENIMALRESEAHLPKDVDIGKLREAAVREQNHQLTELEKLSVPEAKAPSWVEKWKEDNADWALGQENPQHTYRALVDTLCSDAVNLHGFLNNAGTKGRKFFTCHQPAEDDRAAGIRNDFDRNRGAIKQRQESLQALRIKIKIKDRVNRDAMKIEFTDKRPTTPNFNPGIIYFYPFHNSKTHCSYCLMLQGETENFVIEGQIKFDSQDKESQGVRKKLQLILNLNAHGANHSTQTIDNPTTVVSLAKKESKKLKKLALRLQPHEQYLMMGPHELPLKSKTKMLAIKQAIQAKVSADVATAFFDEIRFKPRSSELSNLFVNFNGPKKAMPEAPSLKNHWDQPEVIIKDISFSDSSDITSPSQSPVFDEEDFVPTGLSLQPSYFRGEDSE